MRLALPVIRGDYKAFDAYSCGDDIKVATPIHAMGGDQDPFITLGDLYGWGKHTDTLKVTMFDGGHFFLKSHIAAVAEVLASSARCEQPT
jgi:surfactin synthase thioesterase subunit